MQFDIRRFDVYRKIPKDLTEPTFTGAIISLIAILFIFLLLLSEFGSFVTTELLSELFVNDPDQSEEMIPVRLNISLPHMECKYLGLDIQDDLGRHEVGHVDETEKIELPGGGCRMETSIRVNRVPGNFHVSTHAAGRQQPAVLNFAHTVHSCCFGDSVQGHRHLPGAFDPLRGKQHAPADTMLTHDYLLKVVPTIYENLWGTRKFPYQITYVHRTYSQRNGRMALPAIWFRYELSPLTVRYQERRRPFYSFLTSLCAIVGGTFTVAGLVDSCIFTASQAWKKLQLGKLS